MGKSFFEGTSAPPAAAFPGWTLMAENPEAGPIEIRPEAAEQMPNNRGIVRRGLVAARIEAELLRIS